MTNLWLVDSKELKLKIECSAPFFLAQPEKGCNKSQETGSS